MNSSTSGHWEVPPPIRRAKQRRRKQVPSDPEDFTTWYVASRDLDAIEFELRALPTETWLRIVQRLADALVDSEAEYRRRAAAVSGTAAARDLAAASALLAHKARALKREVARRSASAGGGYL